MNSSRIESLFNLVDQLAKFVGKPVWTMTNGLGVTMTKPFGVMRLSRSHTCPTDDVTFKIYSTEYATSA